MKKVFSKAKDAIEAFYSGNYEASGRGTRVWAESCSGGAIKGILYSYGRHYVLGFVLMINNRLVKLSSERGYSSTTAKHVSYARQFADYTLPQLDNLRRVMNDLTDIGQDLRNKRAKARTRKSWYDERITENMELKQAIKPILREAIA